MLLSFISIFKTWENTYIIALACGRVDVYLRYIIGRTVSGQSTNRHSSRKTSMINWMERICWFSSNGFKEKHVRVLAGIIGRQPSVEHITRRVILIAVHPRLEGFYGIFQPTSRKNIFVNIDGIAPRNWHRPHFFLLLVTDGLLHHSWFIKFRCFHQVTNGVHPFHGRKNWFHHVKMVERY